MRRGGVVGWVGQTQAWLGVLELFDLVRQPLVLFIGNLEKFVFLFQFFFEFGGQRDVFAAGIGNRDSRA